MEKTSPLEFAQQVRTEVSKVTWPSRRETMVTTIFVLIMVLFAALFFYAADQILGRAMQVILGYGG